MPRLAATLPADPFGEVPRVRMPHIPLSRPVVPFTGISTGRDRTLYPNDRPHYYMVSIHTIAIVSIHTIAIVSIHTIAIVSIHTIAIVSVHTIDIVPTQCNVP